MFSFSPGGSFLEHFGGRILRTLLPPRGLSREDEQLKTWAIWSKRLSPYSLKGRRCMEFYGSDQMALATKIIANSRSLFLEEL